jgi:hypothetical protein
MRPVTVAAVKAAPSAAALDPATAMPSLAPGSSVPQPFDHLADRNLALVRRHADALPGAATCAFPHGSTNAG